jgi:N-acetylglutamate synthase
VAEFSPQDILDLERMSIAALPDLEHLTRGGWRWRAARGVTNRANSLTQVALDAAPIEETLDHFAGLTRERGLRAAVRVAPIAPAGTAASLRARGFTERDGALCMLGHAGPFAMTDPRVRLEPASDAVWRGAYARAAGRFDQGEQDILAEIHGLIDKPKRFARIEADGEVIAHGYAVVDGDWVSLHEIGVAPAWRRRGLAWAICGALSHWGITEGASRCWLQVRPPNTAARALYEGMGFFEAYRVTYLAAPDWR